MDKFKLKIKEDTTKTEEEKIAERFVKNMQKKMQESKYI